MTDNEIDNFELEFDSHGSNDRDYIQYITDYKNNHDDLIKIVVDGREELNISTWRDMWGTYITFSIGKEQFTVAQEDETRSFIDSLLFCLNKLRKITDFKTVSPTIILKD